MIINWLALGWVLVASSLPLNTQAQNKAHSHGTAVLNIVVETPSITIQFTSPLDDFLGFERNPRTPQERQRVQALADQMRNPNGLFQLPQDAACQSSSLQLSAPLIGLTANGVEPLPPQSQLQPQHGDLDAVFVFTCAQPTQLTHLNIRLFEAFSRLQQLNIQLVTPRGQSQKTFKRPTQRLPLD